MSYISKIDQNRRHNGTKLVPSDAYIYPDSRADLFDDLAPTVTETVRYRLDRAANGTGSLPPLAAMLAEVERAMITRALELSVSRRGAAAMLGVPWQSFLRKLAALGL